MNGSSVATASPCSREQRTISCVCQQHSSPTCAQANPVLWTFSTHTACQYFSHTAADAMWRGTAHSKWHPSAARIHDMVSRQETGHNCFGASGCEHRCARLQLGVVLIMFLETGLTVASVGSGGKTKTSFKWITGSFLYYKHTYFCLSGGLELYLLKFLVLTGLSELSIVPLEKIPICALRSVFLVKKGAEFWTEYIQAERLQGKLCNIDTFNIKWPA